MLKFSFQTCYEGAFLKCLLLLCAWHLQPPWAKYRAWISVLVCSGCHFISVHSSCCNRLGGLQTIEFYFSCFQRLGSPRSRSWQIPCLLRACFLVLTVSSPDRRGILYMNTNPIHEGPIFMTWSPPKGPPANVITTLGVRIWHEFWGWGGDTNIKHSIYSKQSPELQIYTRVYLQYTLMPRIGPFWVIVYGGERLSFVPPLWAGADLLFLSS